MTVFEKMRNQKIPDYYPTMYQDGYKPYEIIEAAHNAIMRQHQEQTPTNVKFNVEVKTK